MKHFLLILWITVAAFPFAQEERREFELFFRDSPRQYTLYEKDYSLSVYDSVGSGICYFSRSGADSAGVYGRWPTDQLFSEEIVLEDFLSSQNFEVVQSKIPDDEILCEIILLDSLEGEMLPCGNAEAPAPVMKYNFVQQVSVNGRVLIQQRYQDSSFSFRFDRAGYLRYLENITNVWKDKEAKCWYVITDGGFVIVPF